MAYSNESLIFVYRLIDYCHGYNKRFGKQAPKLLDVYLYILGDRGVTSGPNYILHKMSYMPTLSGLRKSARFRNQPPDNQPQIPFFTERRLPVFPSVGKDTLCQRIYRDFRQLAQQSMEIGQRQITIPLQ